MIQKLALSVVVAVVVTLGCILLGGLLNDVRVAVAATIGSFLEAYSAALGILAGIWYFFTH